ncbi:MAG: hypothetical protein R3B99_11795 [Polyangiales bacterium]
MRAPLRKHRVSLRDRAGIERSVEADVGCRNTVFHGRAQRRRSRTAARRAWRRAFPPRGLVRESAEDVTRLVSAYGALIRGEKSARETLTEIRTESTVTAS